MRGWVVRIFVCLRLLCRIRPSDEFNYDMRAKYVMEIYDGGDEVWCCVGWALSRLEPRHCYGSTSPRGAAIHARRAFMTDTGCHQEMYRCRTYTNIVIDNLLLQLVCRHEVVGGSLSSSSLSILL
jgi:hypothetical protein